MMPPVSIQVPNPSAPLTPEKERALFQQFEREEMAFFTPSPVVEMREEEKRLIRGGLPQSEAEQRSDLRAYYEQIPQPDKPGPDRASAQYTSSVVLTEDLLVGYFDRIGDQDVLHIVLVKPREEGSVGWVLPGMRDRAYGPEHADISLQDAYETLVRKEIGVGRDGIAYHLMLGYFDDRLREDRFKSSGIVGFVLLNNRPTLEPGKRIGIPLNALKLLAERRIKLPMQPGQRDEYGLGRNHDSLLLQLFKTAKFYHTIEKLKLAQASFRELLQRNPQASRPALPAVDPKQECHVCMDLMVGANVICSNGHSICGVCLPIIQQNGSCPDCRSQLLARPIRNLALDELIQVLNPAEYQRRYQEMNNAQARSWEQDPAFCGNFITYRA